jgi:hypothetical protein
MCEPPPTADRTRIYPQITQMLQMTLTRAGREAAGQHVETEPEDESHLNAGLSSSAQSPRARRGYAAPRVGETSAACVACISESATSA